MSMGEGQQGNVPVPPAAVSPVGAQADFLDTVRKEAAAAAEAAWKQNQAAFQEQIVNYAQQAAMGAVLGKGVPNAIPTVTGRTITGKDLKIASAKNRSFRTFVQGLGIDLGFALVTLLGLAFMNFDFFSKTAWVTLAALVVKTVIQTAVSYVARMKITPTYDLEPEGVGVQETVVSGSKV